MPSRAPYEGDQVRSPEEIAAMSRRSTASAFPISDPYMLILTEIRKLIVAERQAATILERIRCSAIATLVERQRQDGRDERGAAAAELVGELIGGDGQYQGGERFWLEE